MSLSGKLARQVGKPLAGLLARTAFGDIGGVVAGGLLNIVEQVADD